MFGGMALTVGAGAAMQAAVMGPAMLAMAPLAFFPGK